MRNISLLLALVVLFAAFTTKHLTDKPKYRLPKGVNSTDYIPNTIIIKFKKETKQRGNSLATPHSLTTRSDIVISLEQLFPSEGENDNVARSLGSKSGGFTEYYKAKFTSSVGIEDVINEVLKNDNVEYAEPSYIYQTLDTPDDFAYSVQHAMPIVKASQAWDVFKDASNVTIGIVDTGSEISHPDLASNIYLNTADPIDGIDNDGDGFIDNYYGWDFGGASVSTMIADNDPGVKSAAGDHGVHVSGIASAVTNNGIGIASLARNAKLLIVKASADDSPTSIYFGYEGIKYAVDKGAHIINCSWGGEGGGQFGQDIITYAISKGSLVVAAAGNSGNDIPIYPAAYDGVLAVGNSTSSDQKSSSSNYGSYLDIFAPGDGIFSTVYGGGFNFKSGTSMAAPLVASAAALIKAKNPTFTGEQIREILRNSADNIDPLNSTYAGRLGKGRLNVYRALTETPISVRYEKINVVDLGFGNRAAGSEIIINLSLKNYLDAISGLNVELTTTSQYLSVLTSQQMAGNFASLQQRDNVVAFGLKIADDVPDNHKAVLKFRYSANNGAYVDEEVYDITVGFDYLNINANQIETTLSSVGRIGYSLGDAEGGKGFVYRNNNLLFEASLLIANSENYVMNNARASNTYSEDFKRISVAKGIENDFLAFEAMSEFSDAGSSSPIGLKVKSHLLAFNKVGEDKFVIAEYEIANVTSSSLSNVYTGLFADWDIANSAQNTTSYDVSSNTAITYAKNYASAPYVGVKLLNLTAKPLYYPMSYQVNNDFLADGDFTRAEKYKSLTSGIFASGLGGDGTSGMDVMYTIGSGPYQIPKGESVKVAYALVVGDSREELYENAITAQAKYTSYLKLKTPPASYVLGQNYPNQATTYTYIPIQLPQKTNVTINIYDSTGRKVTSVDFGEMTFGSHNLYLTLGALTRGVYAYQLVTSGGFTQTKKMIVAN